MRADGPRVRFAPSPTGSLHLGNARTALFNWLAARGSGGTFVLRIEDTDIDRQQAGSEEGILADLRWLGLDWDEGPDVGGDRGPYRQSERGEIYAGQAGKLLDAGRAYRCFRTPQELEDDREAGRRPEPLQQKESDRRAAAGEPFALRFHVASAGIGPDGAVEFEDRLRGRISVPLKEIADPVILRPDGRPTYNFAVVVDDAAMAIELVLRGDDHLSNTPRQVLFYRALGHELPEFAHLPMVRGADGSRLSKRHGAVSVAEFRQRGYPVEGVLNSLALLGWSPGADRTLVDRDEMVREFDIDRISRSAATFDFEKLDWLSNQYFQKATAESLASEVGRRLADGGLVPEFGGDPPAGYAGWLDGLAALVQPSLEHTDQIAGRCGAVFSTGGSEASGPAREALASEGALAVVEALAALAAESPPDDVEIWKKIKKGIGERTGLKGKHLFHPIRVALTGETSGPDLDRLVPLIARGSRILPDRVLSVAERAARTARSLA